MLLLNFRQYIAQIYYAFLYPTLLLLLLPLLFALPAEYYIHDTFTNTESFTLQERGRVGCILSWRCLVIILGSQEVVATDDEWLFPLKEEFDRIWNTNTSNFNDENEASAATESTKYFYSSISFRYSTLAVVLIVAVVASKDSKDCWKASLSNNSRLFGGWFSGGAEWNN